MVKKSKSILCMIFAMLIVLSGVAFSQQTISAKQTVTEVKHNTYHDKSNQNKKYMIVKALDKKKKVVWKYKTPSRIYAQAESFGFVQKKNRVYVFDESRLLILNRNTGKRIYTVKNLSTSGHKAIVTKNYTCYYMGTYGENGRRLIKISSKGKIVNKSISINKIKDYYSEPLSIKKSGKYINVKVYKPLEGKNAILKYSAKNCKFLGEK